MITAFLIFFALVLEYVYDPVSNMKDTAVINKYFLKFKDLLKGYKLEKSYVYLFYPIVIIIVFTLLDSFLYYFLHPFFSFLLSLIVLLYCLKPNELNQKLDVLKFSLESKVEFDNTDRFKYILYADKSNDLDAIINNIFYSSIRHIFSVLFTFLLLGPIGCLGYILLDNYIYSDQIKIDQKSKKHVKLIISLIEYLPIRICVFTFAVVANFELCLDKWRSLRKEKDIYNLNIKLINSVGMASFKLNDDNDETNISKIIYSQSMISRSLLAWLSIIGFLVISGVFI